MKPYDDPWDAAEAGANESGDEVMCMCYCCAHAGPPDAPAPLDVERLIDLWVKGHLSNREGQRAAYEMYAMVEDWWDANRDEPYPLPRMSRLPSEEK